MYRDLLNKTCTIYRMNAVDGYDFSLSEEGEVKETKIPVTTLAKCRLEPANTPRDRYAGGLTEAGMQMLFVEAGEDIREHDRVEVDGKFYRVQSVREVYGFHGLHHMEVVLTMIDRSI